MDKLYEQFPFRIEAEGAVLGYFAEVNIPEITAGQGGNYQGRPPFHDGDLVLNNGFSHNSEMNEWYKDVSQSIEENTKDISLILTDRNGKDTGSWNIIKAFPVIYIFTKQEGLTKIEQLSLGNQRIDRGI